MSDRLKAFLAYLVSCGVLAVSGGLLAYGLDYPFWRGAAIGLALGLFLAAVVIVSSILAGDEW